MAPPPPPFGLTAEGTARTEVAEDNRGARRLRELLAGSEPVIAPGAYDALTARLVDQAGFDAVYMTGFGASASLLGQPDVGLLSFAEMVDHVRVAWPTPSAFRSSPTRTTATAIPSTSRAPSARTKPPGVAGLHLEDQLSPKRCGHLEGKQLIAASEMVVFFFF